MLLDLCHLHEHEVVHWDLKSANLLIVKINSFTIIISDLNFLRLITNDILSKIFYESKAYVVPEIVSVDNKVYS